MTSSQLLTWSTQSSFSDVMPRPLGPALACSRFPPSGPLPHYEAAGLPLALLEGWHPGLFFSLIAHFLYLPRRGPQVLRRVWCVRFLFFCFVFTSLSKVSLHRRSYQNSDMRARSSCACHVLVELASGVRQSPPENPAPWGLNVHVICWCSERPCLCFGLGPLLPVSFLTGRGSFLLSSCHA